MQVDHAEFLEASANVPHGFATHYAKDNKEVINAAKDAGHVTTQIHTC